MTANEERSLYELLGVAESASQDDIKRAYRKLARKCHPDVNPGDKTAEEQFKKISAAFDVIGDPEKRRIYDEFGSAGLEPGFDPEKARAYEEWQRRANASRGFRGTRGGGDPFADLGGFDLGDIFGASGGFAQGGSQPGADVETQLHVSLREAVLGAEREIAFQRPAPCEECGGLGHKAAGAPQPCRDCGGSGRVAVSRGPIAFQRTCATCAGTGRLPGPRCPRCGGDGTVEKNVRLKVKVPPGIEDGKTIRLAGQGIAGRAGGPAGDLFLRVHVSAHPRLTRDGRDLALHVPVTVGEAMFGAKIDVPTFQGTIKLTVPSGSQCGTKLRVRGRGVAATADQPAGDLYVVLDVHVPVAPPESEAAQRAAAALDELYTSDVRAGLEL